MLRHLPGVLWVCRWYQAGPSPVLLRLYQASAPRPNALLMAQASCSGLKTLNPKPECGAGSSWLLWHLPHPFSLIGVPWVRVVGLGLVAGISLHRGSLRLLAPLFSSRSQSPSAGRDGHTLCGPGAGCKTSSAVACCAVSAQSPFSAVRHGHARCGPCGGCRTCSARAS